MPPSRPRPPGAERGERLDAAAKRAFDIVVAGLLLVIAAPVMLVIAVAIKRDSPGPVLYRALRVGRDGQSFTMLKFRTMVVGADGGTGITGAADARITRVGRRLRAWRLDELPQLVNVVRGEMSLVGPRPESPRYVAYYTPTQRAVLRVRPGITGPTQLRFHDEAARLTAADVEAQYVRELLPAKLASDLAYVETRSLRDDIGYLLRTARLLIGPRAGEPRP